MDINEALRDASMQLKKAGIDSPWLDAEVLLAHVLRHDRTWLLAHPEHSITNAQQRRFSAMLKKRLARTPLAYITGTKEFYGHTFHVTPAVLIPRPETEQLIDAALPALKRLPKKSLIADIGTGSGCIAITLAKLLPHLQLTATDRSSAALALAKRNARRLKVGDRISWKKESTFEVTQEPKLFAIVSNLPYCSNTEYNAGQQELHAEPKGAIAAGARGDELIVALLASIAQRPKKSPLQIVGLEFDPRRAARIKKHAQKILPLWEWGVVNDLAKRPRILIGKNNNAPK